MWLTPKGGGTSVLYLSRDRDEWVGTNIRDQLHDKLGLNLYDIIFIIIVKAVCSIWFCNGKTCTLVWSQYWEKLNLMTCYENVKYVLSNMYCTLKKTYSEIARFTWNSSGNHKFHIYLCT